MRMRSVFGGGWAGLAFILSASPGWAKELYVDKNLGSDATSYADNGATAPWATLGRASWGSSERASPNPSEAAGPGDTVIVMAGTYSTDQATDERYDPIYNPVNDGAPGRPITFLADGLVVLESNTAGGGEPIIGTYGRSHVVWDGFYIDESNVHTAPDTGPIVVWSSSEVAVQNVEVAAIAADWQDNHNAIRIEASSDVRIANNVLHGVYALPGPHQNNSAIMLYGSMDILIESNTIFDSGGGVFIKGADQDGNENQRTTVRYNHVYGTEAVGIGILSTHVADVYQNVIEASRSPFKLTGFPNTPHDVTFVNNTLIGAEYGALFHNGDVGQFENVRFYSNIVVSSASVAQAQDVGSIGDVDYQHNCYFDNTHIARVGQGDHDLASWQAAHGQDDEPPASVVADPAFVDGPGGDYRLDPASPCRAVGVDILDLDGDGDVTNVIPAGAFITGEEIIGATGGGGGQGGGQGGEGEGGGAGGAATGGASGGPGSGGVGAGHGASSADGGGEDPEGGCGCRVSGTGPSPAPLTWTLLVAVVLGARRAHRTNPAGGPMCWSEMTTSSISNQLPGSATTPSPK